MAALARARQGLWLLLAGLAAMQLAWIYTRTARFQVPAHPDAAAAFDTFIAPFAAIPCDELQPSWALPSADDVRSILAGQPYTHRLQPLWVRPWLAGKRLMVVAALHNSEEILPSYSYELVRLALAARLLGAHVEVSVYESGSTDLTNVLLAHLATVLEGLAVPLHLVTGGHVRPEGQHRIEFLARIRNLGLLPLLQREAGFFDTVFFLNDVFFCANHALQLIGLRETGADMVCGADFVVDAGALRFYDTWVTKDAQGRKFRNDLPYIEHNSSWQDFKAGRPVPVYSCWGGMAAVAASAFHDDGLRFRRNFPTECAASECELLARDLHGLGRHRIYLLPSAVTSYRKEVFFAILSLARVAPQEAVLGLWHPPPPPAWVMCCPLEDACDNSVDFKRCTLDSVGWFYDLYGVPSAGRRSASLEAVVPRGDPSSLTIPSLHASLAARARCKRSHGGGSSGSSSASSRTAGTDSGRRHHSGSGHSTAAGASTPAGLIPHRIVQLHHNDVPARLRQHYWFNILFWLQTQPCFGYELVTPERLLAVARAQPLYASVTGALHGSLRDEALKYLYMHSRGGVYADLDVMPIGPLEALLAEHAGKDFIAAPAAPGSRAWQALRPLPAGSGVATTVWWACSPGSSMLGAVLAAIAHDAQHGGASGELYARYLPGNASASPAPGGAAAEDASFMLEAHLVGAAQLTRAVAAAPQQAAMLPPGALGTGSVDWVYEDPALVNARAWHLDYDVAISKRPARLHPHLGDLPAGVPMADGAWLHSLPAAAAGGKRRRQDVLWQSLEPAVGPAGSEAPHFAWLRSAGSMNTSRGCLQVFRGHGPLDPAKAVTWEACWGRSEELGVVYLQLHGNGTLAVLTADNRAVCSCAPLTPPKALWSVQRHQFQRQLQLPPGFPPIKLLPAAVSVTGHGALAVRSFGLRAAANAWQVESSAAATCGLAQRFGEGPEALAACGADGRHCTATSGAGDGLGAAASARYCTDGSYQMRPAAGFITAVPPLQHDVSAHAECFRAWTNATCFAYPEGEWDKIWYKLSNC